MLVSTHPARFVNDFSKKLLAITSWLAGMTQFPSWSAKSPLHYKQPPEAADVQLPQLGPHEAWKVLNPLTPQLAVEAPAGKVVITLMVADGLVC